MSKQKKWITYVSVSYTHLTVMRKELARFFGDYRMVMTTILLPGILIFVLYQFMGCLLYTSRCV